MKKIINRLRLFQDYFFKKTKVSGLPIELVIEVTNKCNLCCVMCTRKQMKRKIGLMNFALYKKIIDEISAYMELVYLHGLGEPLFHPNIFKMISYAKQKGLSVGISTNATILDKNKAQELLSSGLDYLIIALDAATADTYRKIRGGNFDVVVKNVKEYLRLKRRAKKSPFTVLQFVKTEANKNEVKRFRQMWQNKGAEVIRIKPVIDLLKEKGSREKTFSRPCFYLWRQLNMISWDGKIVTPCCMVTNDEYPLGDATKQTIASIWNGPAMVALRKTQLNGQWKKMPLCQNCTYPQPSILGKLGAFIVPEVTIKKILPFLENLTAGKFVIYD